MFIFLLYVGNFYTTLKLWLVPPLELRVEVTTAPSAYSVDVKNSLIDALQGQELIVFSDGIVAYIPLVSEKRIMIRYPGGAITEWLSYLDLKLTDISLVVSPQADKEFSVWLDKYLTQSRAVAF